MTERKKRNITIVLLCAIVLLMGVGYAAFNTMLNISGTSNIVSNFSVKIINISSKNIVGSANNKEEPKFKNLSATFKTDLVLPGDSIEYEVTIKNDGNLNAVLNNITLSDTNNPAIKFTTSGLNKSDELKSGKTATLLVKVEYLSSVSSQPSSVTSNLTVNLEYGQVTGSGVVPNLSAPDVLKENIVTLGDGLYEDSYESGRYVYRGINPNNYIIFNNEPWRIVSLESDGTLKIVRDEKLDRVIQYDPAGYRPSSENTYCKDASGCNAWSAVSGTYVNGDYSGTVVKDSYLYNYLKTEYYPSLTDEAKAQIQIGNYKNGGVSWASTFDTMLKAEQKSNFTGEIALLSVGDWYKASNNSECTGSSNDWYTPPKTQNDYKCSLNNYLYKNYKWWLITPYLNDMHSVMAAYDDGSISSPNATADYVVRPALYLKSSISLSGEGTSLNPYAIN